MNIFNSYKILLSNFCVLQMSSSTCAYNFVHIFFFMDIDGHKTASRNKNEQFQNDYLLLCTMKVFINLEEERM